MKLRAVILMAALATVAAGAAGCRRAPQEPAKDAVTEDQVGKRPVDWDKATRDAGRMQEKSRQRAERQREQALEKANKADKE
jgi:hypothetical protein